MQGSRLCLEDDQGDREMTMGERIKYLRLKNKLTQTDIADYIGTNKQAVFKYENGIIKNIPLDKIEKIAEILHVSPAYLVGWEK